jgi:hypothetical protein
MSFLTKIIGPYQMITFFPSTYLLIVQVFVTFRGNEISIAPGFRRGK